MERCWTGCGVATTESLMERRENGKERPWEVACRARSYSGREEEFFPTPVPLQRNSMDKTQCKFSF